MSLECDVSTCPEAVVEPTRWCVAHRDQMAEVFLQALKGNAGPLIALPDAEAESYTRILEATVGAHEAVEKAFGEHLFRP